MTIRLALAIGDLADDVCEITWESGSNGAATFGDVAMYCEGRSGGLSSRWTGRKSS